MIQRASVSALLAALVLVPAIASAHVEIASGPGRANATQEVTFAVGHGCAGADTVAVRVQIPAGVTSVRPMRSDFGKPTVERDGQSNITAVTWQKASEELLDGDYGYYKLVVRMKVPDAPFTTLYFPSTQTCRNAAGEETTTEWTAITPSETEEPAPALYVVPAHKPGWNKFTVAQAVPELSLFFPDAQIVWKGSAGYSVNPHTTTLISTTPEVTPLTSLAANDEIWVKY